MAENNIGSHASTLSLGVTVILLYAIFVSLVTFGFGSYIYRTGWQIETAAPRDPVAGALATTRDIDALMFTIKREQFLERAKLDLREDIQVLRRQEAEFDSAIRQSWGVIARAKANQRAQVASVMAELEEFQFELPGDVRTKYESVVTTIDQEAAEATQNVEATRQDALQATQAASDASQAVAELQVQSETAKFASVTTDPDSNQPDSAPVALTPTPTVAEAQSSMDAQNAAERARAAAAAARKAADDAIEREAALTPDFRVRTLLDAAAGGLENAVVDLDTTSRFDALYSRALASLDEVQKRVEEANAVSHDLQSERKLVQDRIAGLRAQIGVHDDNIKALQGTLPVGSPERARLSALSLNLPFVPDILTRLVSFPTIFLTLIVTIAAGGLGTVVAFSRRYYSAKNSEDLTMSRLFVNVGEGIAAAIAIFLFSGAGMLALTQGGGAVNDVELSPYTVAFVAFLSGFMAEDAFASIQAAGKRIFNTEEKDEDEKLAEARARIAKAEADAAALAARREVEAAAG